MRLGKSVEGGEEHVDRERGDRVQVQYCVTYMQCSMHGTAMWHAWYSNVACMVQQCGMYGTAMWHVWYSNVAHIVKQCGMYGTAMWRVWYSTHGTVAHLRWFPFSIVVSCKRVECSKLHPT